MKRREWKGYKEMQRNISKNDVIEDMEDVFVELRKVFQNTYLPVRKRCKVAKTMLKVAEFLVEQKETG